MNPNGISVSERERTLVQGLALWNDVIQESGELKLLGITGGSLSVLQPEVALPENVAREAAPHPRSSLRTSSSTH